MRVDGVVEFVFFDVEDVDAVAFFESLGLRASFVSVCSPEVGSWKLAIALVGVLRACRERLEVQCTC